LRQTGVVFAGVWIACLVTVSWFLAGAILRKPSMRLWFAVLLIFLGISALGGWGVFEAFSRFNEDKAWKVTAMAAAVQFGDPDLCRVGNLPQRIAAIIDFGGRSTGSWPWFYPWRSQRSSSWAKFTFAITPWTKGPWTSTSARFGWCRWA